MIGDDDHVGVVIDMLQDFAQHLIERDVLIGERLGAYSVNFGIVACVVGRNRIEPVPGAIFARLPQPGEFGGMMFEQVVE